MQGAVGGASGALATGMGLAAPVLGGGLRLTLSSFGGAPF